MTQRLDAPSDAAAVVRVYDKTVSSVTRALALFSTTALLIVAFLVTAEIFARSVLKLSVVGVGDFSGLAVAVAIAAAFPCLVVKKGDLVIDLLRDAMGSRAATILSYMGAWVLFIALTLLTWRIGVHTLEFTEDSAVSDVVGIPLAPFFWTVTFFIGLSAALQLIIALRGFRELLAHTKERSHKIVTGSGI